MSRPKGSKNIPKIASGVSMNGGLQNSPQRLFSFGAAQKGGGVTKEGNFSVTQSPSFFYSPELTTESWLLPKSRQEILKWCRIFFNLEPYVQSIIMMHSLYPFSKFDLVTSDKSVTEFYEDMAFNGDFDLYTFILQASLSYQKFGEAIPFGNMEQGKDKQWRWTKFILLEPEQVEIKSDMLTGSLAYEMIPTEEMRALAKSNKPEDLETLGKLTEEAPEVIKAIQQGRNIQLDEANVSLIARITDPSATRGSSPIQSLFKVLIYQDWIRLAQSAYAQRYIFPVELWTIGDLEKNIIPKDADLENFRNIINSAIQQPPFSLVFPPIVKYEALSTLGKNFPINNEYDYILDQLMVGLGVNKNIITGEGPSFSNIKAMALHKLMMVYKAVRDQFENWMIYKYFKPIAEKNGFYTTENGKKKLILPQISWYKSLDIEEEENERNLFVEMHGKGFVSTETLFSKFPSLDYKTEQKKLEVEVGTIWDKGDNRLPAKLGKPPVSGGGGKAPSMKGPKPIAPIPPTEMGGEVGEGLPPFAPATEKTETAPSEETPPGMPVATNETPGVPAATPTPTI